jgi:hypothetical protein
MRNLIKIISIVVLSVILILIISIISSHKIETQKITSPKNQDQTATDDVSSPAKSFAWRYGNAGEDAYGLSRTKIFLDISYENGQTVSKVIDEVQGSCNDIDPSEDDKDMVVNTTKIQCYAAGFGEWYKIVKGDDSYEVRRKYFTEAEPDVLPPVYEYETVIRFQ